MSKAKVLCLCTGNSAFLFRGLGLRCPSHCHESLDSEVSISAIDVLFSGHREGFDMISTYSIGIPDFQPESLNPGIVPEQDSRCKK
jgi:hypothetical protein